MEPDNPDVSIATDVAVADDGTVFFADARRNIVQVFSQEGRYLGILGLADATRRDSPGVLAAPVGLHIDSDRLYIMDSGNGLFVFEFHSGFWTVRSSIRSAR